MALVIYDQGYRIQTPVRALFKPGGVESVEEIKAAHTTASEEQRVHAEGEQYRIKGYQEQLRRSPPRSKPPLRGYERPLEQQPRPGAPSLPATLYMSAPVQWITRNASIADARDRMRNLRIEHLVVMSPQERPLGIVSYSQLERSGQHPMVSVASIYSRHLIAASPDTEASQLAATFVEYEVGAIPIVDSRDRLVGIVTRTDLLRLLISGARIESWA
ncbi:MAG: CBS domain-containing protein [Oceanospirillaceae bacterium]|nr:CBS domain-containing protein [Oceanospirillaceae bacterium]